MHKTVLDSLSIQEWFSVLSLLNRDRSICVIYLDEQMNTREILAEEIITNIVDVTGTDNFLFKEKYTGTEIIIPLVRVKRFFPYMKGVNNDRWEK